MHQRTFSAVRLKNTLSPSEFCSVNLLDVITYKTLEKLRETKCLFKKSGHQFLFSVWVLRVCQDIQSGSSFCFILFELSGDAPSQKWYETKASDYQFHALWALSGHIKSGMVWGQTWKTVWIRRNIWRQDWTNEDEMTAPHSMRLHMVSSRPLHVIRKCRTCSLLCREPEIVQCINDCYSFNGW